MLGQGWEAGPNAAKVARLCRNHLESGPEYGAFANGQRPRRRNGEKAGGTEKGRKGFGPAAAALPKVDPIS